MNRRSFLKVLGAAIAAPFVGKVKPSKKSAVQSKWAKFEIQDKAGTWRDISPVVNSVTIEHYDWYIDDGIYDGSPRVQYSFCADAVEDAEEGDWIIGVPVEYRNIDWDAPLQDAEIEMGTRKTWIPLHLTDEMIDDTA